MATARHDENATKTTRKVGVVPGTYHFTLTFTLTFTVYLPPVYILSRSTETLLSGLIQHQIVVPHPRYVRAASCVPRLPLVQLVPKELERAYDRVIRPRIDVAHPTNMPTPGEQRTVLVTPID